MSEPVPYEIRAVVGHEGYMIDTQGIVFSDKRQCRTQMATHLDEDGYERVRLHTNGIEVKRFVHHLVLEAFVGPRDLEQQTRHRDGVRTHNTLSNLLWGTVGENQEDKKKHGTQICGEATCNAKLTSADVEWIRAYPKRSGMFKEMSRRLVLSYNTIWNAYHGVTWSHV